ncbi:MAG: serine/threonine-protein kinase [Candidatus Nitrotoga sp.]
MDRIGKYEILRELGHGATSTVYLALDTFNNQQVALKLFDLQRLNDTSISKAYRKLLLTEASLAGKLSHPHIVKVLDAVMEDELSYIVMEYVDGKTLDRNAEVDNLLPLSTVAEIIYKCCKALEYAQFQGITHRDIKPENILLCGESDIKIADFGAAMLFDQQTTQVSGVGSPAYMSPEQVKDLPLTHQTDIYSLGVVMYKLLTGKLPFDARNKYSLIYQIMNIEPPVPSTFRPEMPSEMDAIVLRAMNKDKEKRYQTWADFAHDLVYLFSGNVADQTHIFDREKFDTLRKLSFFRSFSDVELWEILRISIWQKFEKNEVILKDESEGSDFFVIAQGMAKVMKNDRMLNILKVGDCFGEMAHLNDQGFRRTTDVIAKTDVTLIEFKPAILDRSSIECRFKLSDAFLRVLVKRLAVANTRVSYLLQDNVDR